jgi:hypothetical protein
MLVRMRTCGIHVIGFLLAAANVGVHAQCLEDADGDGHPIFRHTFQRPDVEQMGGESYVADATGVAFGDLDADGDVDAVVAQARDEIPKIKTISYLTVLLNHGDGVFAPGVLYEAGQEVTMPVLADLDSDGDLDIAASNATSDTVSILFNDGTGVFGQDVEYAVGTMPRSLVAEDLDADGDIDLAVLNVGGSGVSILLNNGDGGFAPQVQFIVGAVTPRGNPNLTMPVPGPFLAAGDLDNDADVDLAIPAGGVVRILVNDGAGAFSLSRKAADVIGFDAYDIVIEDLNSDGLVDLAAVTSKTSPTAVNVMLNEGDLTFAPPVAYDADFVGCGCVYNNYSIDAGDLDGDGAPELVVGNEYAEGFVVLRNAGDGTFGPMEAHNSFRSPWVVKLVDVSGDGHEDFVCLTYWVRSGLRIYINDGEGNLIEPELISNIDHLGTGANWRMAAGDLDADGDADMASVRGTSQVALFEGHGDGTFTVLGEFSVDEPADLYDIGVGDLNGDGLGDFVLADDGGAQEDPGAVWIALQKAPLEFKAAAPIRLDDSEAYQVAIADLDGDGASDAVVLVVELHPGDPGTPVDRRVLVLLNDGSGALAPAQELAIASHAWFPPGDIELGDIDADGDLDVVAGTGQKWTPGQLTILTNDGMGTLSIASNTEVQAHPQAILLRDLDADGDLDLALMANHNFNNPEVLAEPYLSIAMNDGAGDFTFVQDFVDSNTITRGQMVAADFDNDADIDLALPDINGSMLVHLNDGAGSFDPGARYTGVDTHEAAAAADVDMDGRIDLLVGNRNDAGIMIFRNRSCPPCLADFNADGALDILDFVAFQQAFVNRDPAADCNADGALHNPADFICFQQQFIAGCR